MLVDRDAVLDLIDQLRVAIPEEVTAAKRINAESERIMDQAQQEGERAVARAQEQAAFMIGERGLTEAAQAESRRIIDDAEAVAEGVRQGADDYARQMLESLEDEMRRALDGITKGIAVLDDRRAELRGPGADGGEAPEAGPNGRDWADVDDSPAFLREGDAGGQAVPR